MFIHHRCLLLLPTALLISVASAQTGPVAAIGGGRIQGRSLPNGTAVFKGIPFAQPPEGELRWREPMPVKPWTEVRQAAEYGPPCAQAGNGPIAETSKEDCLYLNVWTPEWPAKGKLPVMYWLYGGANTGGSAIGKRGIEPEFDGTNLARRGVVVVTINYRVGLLGFIGHPELTADAAHHAPGAFGLLDQIAGLRWVRDNIAKFGGDPANVTIFGQSAGAQNLTTLLAAPAAKGLIHKAISESGTPMIGDKKMYSPARMEQLGTKLAELLHAPEKNQMAYLRTVPPADILKAMDGIRAAGLMLDVNWDGQLLPSFPPEVYRQGKELAIPLMIGNNGQEMPLAGGGRGRAPASGNMTELLTSAVSNFYGKYPDLLSRASAVYGLDGSGQVSTYPPWGDAGSQFRADTSFRCEAVVLAAWHSKVAPVYEFEFTGGTAAHPPSHSSELKYVFGLLDDQATDASARRLSDAMQQYWVNFAKTGNPNGVGLPEWPKFDGANKRYLELSMEGPLPKAALRNQACTIYSDKLNRDLDELSRTAPR